MKVVEDETSAYSQLLYAVVARAIQDACKVPCKDGALGVISRDALDFLFSSRIDVYLDLLDLNPERFKQRLLDAMWGDKEINSIMLDEASRRSFRINYKRWHQKNNKKLLQDAMYKRRAK